MKTFILEDNQSSRDLFRKYLREDSPEIIVTGEAANLREARAFLARETPDLVLFDIDLPDGTSFDLLQELSEADQIDFDIIFITAFGTQEFLVQALEFSALKYLSKPLDRKELRKAVQKALDRHYDKQSFVQQISMLLQNSKQPQPVSDNIAIPLSGGLIEMVRAREILYIASYAKGTMSQVFLRDKEKPLTSNRALGQFIRLLTNGFPFIQIHESYLINTNALRRYDPAEKTVLLQNGTVLHASRRYGKLLKEQLLGENSEGLPPLSTRNLLTKMWRKLLR